MRPVGDGSLQIRLCSARRAGENSQAPLFFRSLRGREKPLLLLLFAWLSGFNASLTAPFSVKDRLLCVRVCHSYSQSCSDQGARAPCTFTYSKIRPEHALTSCLRSCAISPPSIHARARNYLRLPRTTTHCLTASTFPSARHR